MQGIDVATQRAIINEKINTFQRGAFGAELEVRVLRVQTVLPGEAKSKEGMIAEYQQMADNCNASVAELARILSELPEVE